MKKNIFITLLAFSVFTFISCGGDKNNSSSDGNGGLSDNACSAIGLNAKIINGTECSGASGSAIVEVVIVNPTTNKEALCTGTMISSNAVLTAAHCFTNFDTAFTAITVAGVSYPATSVSIHPNFRRAPSTFGDSLINDLAIIKLARSPGLPTLPLAESVAIKPNDVISIFGYGLDNNENSGKLLSGEALINDVSSDHILEIYDGSGSNTCQGDSGGPAIVAINGLPAVVGTTSTGTVDGCGKGDMSLYTNLQNSSNLSFIRSEVPGVGTR